MPNARKPLTLRISVTDLCQHRCVYCMPLDGVPKVPHGDVLRLEEMAQFADAVRRVAGLSKVRITGGEPLVRPGVGQLLRLLAGQGVADIALTTNGAALAEMAAELRSAGLQRVNVSLDTLVPETYRRLTRGGDLAGALAGIDAAMAAGLNPVKLNTVVLRGLNDHEVLDIARFALERGCQPRFLELMPIGPAAERMREWQVTTGEVRARLAAAFDMAPIGRERGGSSERFKVRGHGVDGLVGFISPQTSPFCSDCRRLRLTATGRLLGCLAQQDGAPHGALRTSGPWLASAADQPQQDDPFAQSHAGLPPVTMALITAAAHPTPART